MSIYNYLVEDLDLYKIISMIMNEDIDDVFTKPANFKYRDGEYHFTIDYKENGEEKTSGIVVDIETKCTSSSIEVTFMDEDDDEFKTINRGGTAGEQIRSVKSVMNGVMYAIGYHIDHMKCTANKIIFLPFNDNRDTEVGHNRRNVIYIKLAQRYLNKIGIEIDHIDETYIYTRIYTKEPFGGNSDDGFAEHLYKFVSSLDVDDEIQKETYDTLLDAHNDNELELKDDNISYSLESFTKHINDYNKMFKYLDDNNMTWEDIPGVDDIFEFYVLLEENNVNDVINKL